MRDSCVCGVLTTRTGGKTADNTTSTMQNHVKSSRTIPIDLEDWLHGFTSVLDSHPWPKEIPIDREERSEREFLGSGFAGRLTSNRQLGTGNRVFAL